MSEAIIQMMQRKDILMIYLYMRSLKDILMYSDMKSKMLAFFNYLAFINPAYHYANHVLFQ